MAYFKGLGAAADSVKDMTETLKSVNSLMKTADPFMKMALQTFKTAVSANPAMFNSAIAWVPEPMQSQIKAAASSSPTKEKQKTASAQAAAPFDWKPILIGGGVLGGVVAVIAIVRSRKKKG